MKVAIVGAGNVGKGLGGSLVRAGHQVTLAGRDVSAVGEAAGAIGARAATVADAVAAAEVVVIAVPYPAVSEVLPEIGSADGKVVIDATNPLKADFSGLALEGTSGAEEIARALPGAKVAKAFNTTFAGVDADPAGAGTTLDSLFAADDPDARAAVTTLASSIGFRPVWVGPLVAARELEALAWLNIRLQVLTGGAWNTSVVLVNAPEAALAA